MGKSNSLWEELSFNGAMGTGDGNREGEIHLGANFSQFALFKVKIDDFRLLGVEGYWEVESRV